MRESVHPLDLRDRSEKGKMDTEIGLTPRQSKVNGRFAYMGCIVAQTGVQLVAPSLPVMRDALELSDTQLSLVMGFYLLPAALGAIPAGILADKIGRRQVFGWAMIGLGLCGVALQFFTESFGIFLAIRFVQGLAFAGLLPLTMTILGDAFRGSELIGAQGRRSVAMLVGDGFLPIAGGVLASISWQAPWLGQVLAIPFGIAVLAKLTDPSSLIAKADTTPLRARFSKAFRVKGIYAIQYASFLRLFLKFSMLTFLPVLLVDERDLSPAFAGLIVGASAVIGMVPSATAARIARFGRASTFVAIGIAFEAIALAGWALLGSPAAILIAAVVFGIADGLSGVFVNSIVAATPDTESRASFIAVTGAIRNFAKFLGPISMGVLIIVMSLPAAFVFLAALTFVSTAAAIPLRGLDARLQDMTSDKRGDPTPVA
ncbi:MAG: ACDE family multidrug resistance protein [Verrucomicrobiales bacterium]|jgi:ACDE family multidrug resistance protein